MSDDLENRSRRSLDMLPGDAEIWCCTFEDSPHIIGIREDVKFYDAKAINDEDAHEPHALAFCRQHQALVMWLALGSKIAPRGPEDEPRRKCTNCPRVGCEGCEGEWRSSEVATVAE